MPQLSTITNGFLQTQKANEVGSATNIDDQIAERKIMSPRSSRQINLLSQTRPNIQNLFPIEKPKFLGAGGDSS